MNLCFFTMMLHNKGCRVYHHLIKVILRLKANSVNYKNEIILVFVMKLVSDAGSLFPLYCSLS